MVLENVAFFFCIGLLVMGVFGLIGFLDYMGWIESDEKYRARLKKEKDDADQKEFEKRFKKMMDDKEEQREFERRWQRMVDEKLAAKQA